MLSRFPAGFGAAPAAWANEGKIKWGCAADAWLWNSLELPEEEGRKMDCGPPREKREKERKKRGREKREKTEKKREKRI